jgi:type I restriction enzyme, S subunit
MNTTTAIATLRDVASFVRGITFKPDDVVPAETPGAILCMRTKNVQSNLDLSDVWAVPPKLVRREDQFLRAGDVLVSSANSWNLVGKCCWVPELKSPASFGGFVSVLRADTSKVDARYLYHWFSTPRTQATVRSFGRQTTNISNLDFDRCLKLPLPLPLLAEQRRIAEVLDRADELRAKRREALAHLDDLTQSIFLDTFGDPVQNTRGWSRLPLSAVLERIDSGHSPRCLDRRAGEDEWGVLKLGAVTSCEFMPDENKALPPGVAPRQEHAVREGDLLFSRKNTRELVGACALVRAKPSKLLLPDLIFRLELSPDAPLDKVFLQQLLVYPTKRRQIQSLAGGSAGSMPNISKAKLMRARVELPPLTLQRDFARQIDATEELKTRQRADLALLDRLFESLRDGAFRGLP